MDRTFVGIGAISAFLGVALGAFAAHGLRQRLAVEMLVVFEVGVRYQMYHALGMIAVGLVLSRWPSGAAVAAGWLFVAGTVLFSGSLYALSLTGTRGFGAITPVGGLAFLAGWLALASGVFTAPR